MEIQSKNLPEIITGNPSFRDRCAARMADITDGVQKTRMKGKITITIEVEASGISDDGFVNQLAYKMTKCEAKVPEVPLNADVWFVGNGGKQQKRDPRQPDLPMINAESTEPEDSGDVDQSKTA